MSRAEKFISDCTKNCSNYTGVINKKTYEGYYVPWLTPDQSRKAVEIAKEEVIEQMVAKAVDGEVTYGKSIAIPSLGWVLDKEGLDYGDKVKLIIIKEN